MGNLDFPMMDNPLWEHRLGAIERDNTFVHLFKGFMTEWCIEDQFRGGETPPVVFFDEDTCTDGVVPCRNGNFNDEYVLNFSDCDALYYVDGDDCLPCMTSCTKGCIGNPCS